MDNPQPERKLVSIFLVIFIYLSVVAVAAFFISPKPALPQPWRQPISESQNEINPDSPFGMSGAYSRPLLADDKISRAEVYEKVAALKEPYKDVEGLGAKWIRPGIDITWDLVQPGHGYVSEEKYDWSVVDNLYGRAPQGVSVFANIGANQGLEPATWKFISSQAEKDYITYVQNVVERYDGDGYKDMPGLENPIKYWQTHNEPAGIPLANLPNTDWRGFAHVQEITYKAIKESDPEAKVAMGGFAMGHLTGTADPKFTQEYNNFFLPILRDLKGKYIDIYDIHYYGAGADWRSQWKGMKGAYELLRNALDENGYGNTEIWFTETAIPSVPFGEKVQAIDLVKRFVYPLSFGAKRVFWWNMIEGEPPLETDKPSNHMGLIYDGTGPDDSGYGTKKLSYHAYRKIVEVLEGSDWDETEAFPEADGIYVYKFVKNDKPIWVAWNENGGEKEISISGITSKEVTVTAAVPRYDSGREAGNYENAFQSETKIVAEGKISLTVGEVPVYAEE